MAKVSVFHNVSRDSSFGLNAVLKSGPVVPEGATHAHELRSGGYGWKEEAKGDERHELVWVFQYEAKGFETDDEVLNDSFEMFNVGEGPIAMEYRAKRLRSLSKGDVVMVDGRVYSCESFGWKRRSLSELRTLPAREAEPVIRARYEIWSSEPLSITVPLAD